MFASIWEDLKREFSSGTMITRLIIINVAVYVVINLVNVFTLGFYGEGESFLGQVVEHMGVSSDFWEVLTHPWTLFSNMFLHIGFMHILFNMLFLYWFGRIVGDLIGNRHILPMYLLSGLAGVLIYMLSVNLFQYGGGGTHIAYGASGAVMGIVAASAVLAPEYLMNLLLIGAVRLKYIVLALILLDLFAIGNNVNTGGHFAHLGGAAFGWFYVVQLRSGNNLGEPLNKFFDAFVTWFRGIFGGDKYKNRKPKVVYRNKARWGKSKPNAVSDTEDFSHQERLDAILEKIKLKGYESLTSEEKEFLFNASKK